MIADDRESQIVDRRKFCDRLRSYGNQPLRRKVFTLTEISKEDLWVGIEPTNFRLDHRCSTD